MHSPFVTLRTPLPERPPRPREPDQDAIDLVQQNAAANEFEDPNGKFDFLHADLAPAPAFEEVQAPKESGFHRRVELTPYTEMKTISGTRLFETGSSTSTPIPPQDSATGSRDLSQGASKVQFSPEAESFVLRSLSSKLGSPRRELVGSKSASVRKSSSARKASPSAGKPWAATPQRAGHRVGRSASTGMKKSGKKRGKKKASGSASKHRTPGSGRRPRKRNQAGPRPAWDSTIHDLDRYKLSKEELTQQKVLHVSRFDRKAQKRLEEDGITLEEQERALSSVLSPTWLIKHKSLERVDDGAEAGDACKGGGEGEVEGVASQGCANGDVKDKVLGASDASSEDRFGANVGKELKEASADAIPEGVMQNTFDELLGHVERYESVCGRAGALPSLDHALGNQSREMKLMKLCTRLMGHLASCEKQLEHRTEVLASTVKGAQVLEARLEDAKEENAQLERHCQDLEKQVVHLRAVGSPLERIPKRSSPQGAAEGRADGGSEDTKEALESEQRAAAKISRRHRLMARWREESMNHVGADGDASTSNVQRAA